MGTSLQERSSSGLMLSKGLCFAVLFDIGRIEPSWRQKLADEKMNVMVGPWSLCFPHSVKPQGKGPEEPFPLGSFPPFLWSSKVFPSSCRLHSCLIFCKWSLNVSEEEGPLPYSTGREGQRESTLSLRSAICLANVASLPSTFFILKLEQMIRYQELNSAHGGNWLLRISCWVLKLWTLKAIHGPFWDSFSDKS